MTSFLQYLYERSLGPTYPKKLWGILKTRKMAAKIAFLPGFAAFCDDHVVKDSFKNCSTGL